MSCAKDSFLSQSSFALRYSRSPTHFSNMDRQNLLLLLDGLFEVPAGSLKGPESLEDLPLWDSLGVMSFIALASEHCDVTLSPLKIVNCKTVNDLLDLVGVAVA